MILVSIGVPQVPTHHFGYFQLLAGDPHGWSLLENFTESGKMEYLIAVVPPHFCRHLQLNSRHSKLLVVTAVPPYFRRGLL